MNLKPTYHGGPTRINLNFAPAVDRQPWSPRGVTRREGSAASRMVTARLFESELLTGLPELTKNYSKIESCLDQKMTQNHEFLRITGVLRNH